MEDVHFFLLSHIPITDMIFRRKVYTSFYYHTYLQWHFDILVRDILVEDSLTLPLKPTRVERNLALPAPAYI